MSARPSGPALWPLLAASSILITSCRMSVAMSSNCFVVIMLMIITLYQTLELTLKTDIK